MSNETPFSAWTVAERPKPAMSGEVRFVWLASGPKDKIEGSAPGEDLKGVVAELARMGIEFTILAPWQADEPDLDVTRPYWVDLPGDKRIAVFFYNQNLSTRVSFDPGATVNADRFVLEALPTGVNADQEGNRVFDGVLTHVAGMGRVFLNTPFAQPFRFSRTFIRPAIPSST